MSTPTAEELLAEAEAASVQTGDIAFHDLDACELYLAQRLATALAEVERLSHLERDLRIALHCMDEECASLRQRVEAAEAEVERLREAFDRELRENVADEVGEKLVELRQRAEEAEAEVERLRGHDKKIRDSIQAWFQSEIDKANAKLAEAQKQIIGRCAHCETAQQREAWWRELYDIEAMDDRDWSGMHNRRYHELRRLLGLENG